VPPGGVPEMDFVVLCPWNKAPFGDGRVEFFDRGRFLGVGPHVQDLGTRSLGEGLDAQFPERRELLLERNVLAHVFEQVDRYQRRLRPGRARRLGHHALTARSPKRWRSMNSVKTAWAGGNGPY
jgi:hypothetical protein